MLCAVLLANFTRCHQNWILNKSGSRPCTVRYEEYSLFLLTLVMVSGFRTRYHLYATNCLGQSTVVVCCMLHWNVGNLYLVLQLSILFVPRRYHPFLPSKDSKY